MFAHLFSFLGLYEQSAVVNNEIQLLLDLHVHFEQLCPEVHLIDFRVTRSMQKRHTRA